MKRISPGPAAGLAAGAILLAFNVTSLLAKDESSPLELARQLNQAFIEVADKVSPAVVVIRVAHKASYSELDDSESPFWDMIPHQFRRQLQEQWEKKKKERDQGEKPDQEKPSRGPVFNGEGSGVVIREEGFILSNRHVVEDAEKIKVRFKDGDEFEAEVRGVDTQSDVAVLKINPKGKKLTVAKLGDSEKTRVGEFAIAIGAPFELDYSVTFGHVSAKGRTHIIDDPSMMDQDFLQTDANINPGNSGGPLVNIAGEVIGINTLIRGLHTGIGFAIPSNLAREVADQLITEGKFVRSYLGVKIQALKDFAAYRERVPSLNDGVVITEIRPDGPAAKSDLKPTDVITAVDGKPVATPQQLRNEIRTKKVGQTVMLDVYRGGKNLKVKVKTYAWPDETSLVVNKHEPPPADTAKSFGLTVQPLTKELAEQYGIETTEGVIITEVEKGGAADAKALRPGDIITEVNQKTVKTPKQFREAIKAGDAKKGIIINFMSRGTSKFEILKESGE